MKRLALFFLSIAAFAQQNALMLPWTPQQFTDTTGRLLTSGKVCTYLAGTSTGTATFTDSTASVSNNVPPNAILLDSTARPTSGGIWLTPNKAYKIVTMTSGTDSTCSTGVVIKTQDNVVAQSGAGTANNNAFTGNNTFKNLNRVRMVDFANASGWAGSDACAWINSAVTDIGAGNTGIIDARGLAGGTSTCTSGTVTIPQNIQLLIAGTISTNANPGFSFTGGTVQGGISGGLFGAGRLPTQINCTLASNNCLAIGDGVNIMRGFSIESLKVISSGNTIKFNDGATHIHLKDLQLNPSLSCIVFQGGANSIGYQFEDFDSIRCDGYSGVGFNANLSGATVGGTNMQITNVYINDSGSTTGTIGFDIEKWVAVTINSSDHDSNGATGSTVGFKLAGVGGTGTFTVNTGGCESMPTGSSCFQVAGVGSYVFTAPHGVSLGLGAFAPGSLIDVSAVSDVIILNPFSSATGGTNDIVFEAAAAGGNYAVYGGGQTSKPIISNSPTLFQLFQGNQVTQGFGLNTQPRNVGSIGVGPGTAPNAIARVEFDRSGAHKFEIGNEGIAQGVINGSAQDDTFLLNEVGGGINLSSNTGNTIGFRLIPQNGGIFVGNPQTAPTCAFTSGGGTSPSCAVDTDSSNTAGIIIATTGTGAPATNGTITLTFGGTFGTNKPACKFLGSLNGAGQWGSLATFQDKTPSTTTDLFQWNNATGATPAGVALATSTAYWINYDCFAK